MQVDASKISEVFPHRERFPHTRLSAFTRRSFQRLLWGLSWIWFGLIGVVVINVTMRYLFGEGRIEFEEIQWHLYSVGFLIGLATCMDTDNHVRVDIFHANMSLRQQAWVELYGLLLLFFPFAIAMLAFSIPFVSYSFEIGEVSDAPGGLPYRWAIKSFLPLGIALMLLAAVSRLSRVTAYLFGWPRNVD
ncbi:MAG: TRAP transporter small permease subunit [Xanthomonadales bacterium]|nr:TRAP transporter small permease subunit [Gammaproteobacteria bacterium]NND58226.1 TRAP transporter small permease subunit [Xanthomonadales bacterium]NNK50065.1 TRAP transporter small permease subunit [Xanthomonadales bacterium]